MSWPSLRRGLVLATFIWFPILSSPALADPPVIFDLQLDQSTLDVGAGRLPLTVQARAIDVDDDLQQLSVVAQSKRATTVVVTMDDRGGGLFTGTVSLATEQTTRFYIRVVGQR